MNVIISPEAREQYFRLPKVVMSRVAKTFARLADWPDISGAKPLRGDLAGYFRVRTGDYRVQFRVQGQTLFVEKIGHRDGFYEA